MAKQITEQGKQLVVQSNPLVNAQYKLDLIEQKVLRYIISMIRPHDDTLEKNFYRVRIEELQEYLGWNPKSGELFQYIKRVADRLKATTIKIIKTHTTIVTSWIASYEYPKNLGWIEFEFSSKLETELLQLKEQFTQYYLKNVSKLKSRYSIRLYELLRQYLSAGERKESMANLRTMIGIEANEYKEFRDFKRRILEPSYKEIIQKTDIDFDWKPVKEARKVVGVLFYDIKQKTLIPDRVLELIPKKYRESRQILDAIRKKIELCGEDYVTEKLNYTNARNPKKWVSYFLLALDEDYGAGYTPPAAEDRPAAALNDGTKVLIRDQIYTVEEGVVMTEHGVIPRGPLAKGIREGKFKIVDNAG